MVLLSCSQTEKPSGQAPAGRIPDSVLQNATITISSDGKKQAVIVADTLYIFEKEDSTTAYNIKIDFYNNQGIYQSTLIAKHGLVHQKSETFTVWGDVIAKNDSTRLDTQSLNWSSQKNLIWTDDFVKLRRHGDIISGYGMEADSKLEHVRILRDVSGKITDIPKSENELDSLDKSGNEGKP